MSEQHDKREADRWTDPTVDPVAGLPATFAVLKTSQWITDPHGAPDDDPTDSELDDDKQPSGWAFVEVGCGGEHPVVAFRIPLDADGWGYVSAGDAVAFGTALIRIAGAAQASVIYDH